MSLNRDYDIDEKAAQEILGKIHIPPQPDLLLKVQKEMGREYPDLRVIASAISSDVGLTSTLLRIVNSPYYGLRNEINSVPHAMSLLGVQQVFNLVASVLFRISIEGEDSMPMPRYWDNASDVARLCSFAAKELRLVDPDLAYTLGLFYDCGIPILAKQFTDYKPILAAQNVLTDGLYTDLEDQKYHTTHCIVGYLLTRSWGLPAEIRNVILTHHDPAKMAEMDNEKNQPEKNLLAILKIADHVSNFHRDEFDPEWARYSVMVLEHLSLSEPDFEVLRDDMRDLVGQQTA